MERLTMVNQTTGKAYLIDVDDDDVRDAIQKLAEYEDLEEQLEKVYGEHDGLFETVVKSLVKYNGEKPRKARLLTDEDADRWEEYKRLEEQGLLIKLPCKVGATLWTNCRMQGWYFRLKDAPYRVQVVFIGLNNSDEMGGGLLNVSYENHSHMMQFNFSDIGKTVFLTKEAAEAALKEMEK